MVGGGANVGEEELYPGNAFSPLCLLYKACKNKSGKNVNGAKAVLCLPGRKKRRSDLAQ